MYVYFVSPEGNDSWSGSLPEPGGKDGPFATLTRARDAVRSLKTAGPLEAPVSVIVRGGRYYLDETVAFKPEDSGTRECPVTFAAYPGETPVFSGGTAMSTAWETVDDGVVSCAVENMASFRQLSVNDRLKPRARIPETGYFEIEEALDDTSFRYRKGDMTTYGNPADAEVVVLHSWNESRFRISDLDEETRTVRFRNPGARHVIGWSGAGGPNRYYVENVFEGLTRPGSWYADNEAGVLYYRPEEETAGALFVAPRLRQLVCCEGNMERGEFLEFLRFEGLVFADTDWDLPENGYPDCGDVGDIVDPAAITFAAARYCEFRGNEIRNTGTYGLEINGYGNVVEDNDIHDTGSGGIVTRNFHPESNLFRYNHIHHCGHTYPSAVGINIDEGGGVFANNLIHDVSHSGIYTRHWATEDQAIERRNQEQELRIENNEIYDVATVLDDAAGIFVRDANIIIRNNLIHDVHSGGKRCPGWGIYLGCETRDTIVERNLVYNCLESLHVWYRNRNVTVTNNIFVGSEQYQINFGNPEHLSHENIRIVGNVIYCTSTRGRLFTVHGKRSLPLVSNYNVIFSGIGCVLNDPVITRLDGIDSFTDWRSLGLDADTITADPGFADSGGNDFSLTEGSPAFDLGFKQLDFSNVGLRGRT